VFAYNNGVAGTGRRDVVIHRDGEAAVAVVVVAVGHDVAELQIEAVGARHRVIDLVAPA